MGVIKNSVKTFFRICKANQPLAFQCSCIASRWTLEGATCHCSASRSPGVPLYSGWKPLPLQPPQPDFSPQQRTTRAHLSPTWQTVRNPPCFLRTLLGNNYRIRNGRLKRNKKTVQPKSLFLQLTLRGKRLLRSWWMEQRALLSSSLLGCKVLKSS